MMFTMLIMLIMIPAITLIIVAVIAMVIIIVIAITVIITIAISVLRIVMTSGAYNCRPKSYNKRQEKKQSSHCFLLL